MKTLLLLAILLVGLMISATAATKNEMPKLTKEFENGSSIWQFSDGRMILVVPPWADARPLVDKACKAPCASRFVGEMWQLTPLK